MVEPYDVHIFYWILLSEWADFLFDLYGFSYSRYCCEWMCVCVCICHLPFVVEVYVWHNFLPILTIRWYVFHVRSKWVRIVSLLCRMMEIIVFVLWIKFFLFRSFVCCVFSPPPSFMETSACVLEKCFHFTCYFARVSFSLSVFLSLHSSTETRFYLIAAPPKAIETNGQSRYAFFFFGMKSEQYLQILFQYGTENMCPQCVFWYVPGSVGSFRRLWTWLLIVSDGARTLSWICSQTLPFCFRLILYPSRHSLNWAKFTVLFYPSFFKFAVSVVYPSIEYPKFRNFSFDFVHTLTFNWILYINYDIHYLPPPPKKNWMWYYQNLSVQIFDNKWKKCEN